MATNIVTLTAEICNGCGICVKTCPQMVFHQENVGKSPTLANEQRCFGCMACEEDCPRGAIVVHRLPDDMTRDDIPQPGLAIDEEKAFDLVIIGAGPAGLGAAIRGRMLGLDTIVLERLPSSKRSHHPDGGLLFAPPEIYQVHDDGKRIRIEELDLELPSSLILERLQDFSFVGPAGQRTKRREKEWSGFPIVDKDLLVHYLANRARELGADLCYNTRAKVISPVGTDGLRLVKTGGNKKLKAKVVISAEGVTGRLTEAAGVPVNANPIGWSISPYASFPPVEKPTRECSFIVGRGPGKNGIELPYLRYTSSGPAGTHLAAGPIQRDRFRSTDEPATTILERMINESREEQEILGHRVTLSNEQLDGCRAFVRRIPDTFVGPALIAVGDAITTCGMITNLLAIKTGDLAAAIAHSAIEADDRSENFLRRFDAVMGSNQMFQSMSWMTNLLFRAPMELPLDRQNELYSLLRHLCLSKIQAGELWPLFAFYMRISPTLLFDSELRSYLVPW